MSKSKQDAGLNFVSEMLRRAEFPGVELTEGEMPDETRRRLTLELKQGVESYVETALRLRRESRYFKVKTDLGKFGILLLQGAVVHIHLAPSEICPIDLLIELDFPEIAASIQQAREEDEDIGVVTTEFCQISEPEHEELIALRKLMFERQAQ